MSQKIVTNGVFKIDRKEDGGQALIGEPFSFDTDNSNDDNGMVVTIQSWDENKKHTDINALVGKNVRVTIEVIEDEEYKLGWNS